MVTGMCRKPSEARSARIAIVAIPMGRRQLLEESAEHLGPKLIVSTVALESSLFL